MQRTNRPVWRVAASIFIVMLVTAIALPAIAESDGDEQTEVEPIVVDPTIQAVWDITDGQIISGQASRAWAFGPEPIAAAYEYYPQSPTQFRKIVYYDKGRLDLVNPQAPAGSIWMVSGALLTTEMFSGRIQLGESEFVVREPADIPLVGDLEQPDPVTYATLARHSSIEPAVLNQSSSRVDDAGDARRLSQVGKQVTELLRSDGSIVPDAVVEHDIVITAYEDLLGHNVASPFANWAADLEVPALNLLGLPITEPYWIETEIDGVSSLVLIQAFERRTLTYTPSNPENWRVESGNVGLHYRLWRGLERPARPEFARMAAEIPFGEEILLAAREAFIDPYIFAAISLNSTNGNPFVPSENGGHGLLGAHETEDQTEVDLNDPGVNARVAAEQFAREMYAAWDWQTIVSSYFRRSNVDTSADAAGRWASAVIETSDRLLAHYPPTGPRVDPVREEGQLVGEGHAAHYDPSYDAAWWQNAMGLHAGWGNAVEGWKPDPNDLYCVHPDYLIGERLRLEANDRVVECTIGDRVAVPHQIAWRAKWVVELSWSTFVAAGLDRNNEVTVTYLGDRIIEPTPTPDPSATPEDGLLPGSAKPDRQVPPPDANTPPEVTPTPVAPPSATEEPPVEVTPEPTPSPDASPTATATPSETPTAGEIVSPTPEP